MSETATVQCGYHEHNRRCHEAAVIVLSISGNQVGLCERHRRPEFHPPDLHKPLRKEARQVT